MKLDRRKLLRFVAWVAIFLGLIGAYPFIVKLYEPVVLGTANAVMERLDPPTRMAVDSRGMWRAVVEDRGYTRIFSLWNTGVKYLHFLSIALLPPLLLATPAPWRVRFRLLAIAMPLLFAAHTLAIIGITRTNYCVLTDPYNTVCRIAMRITNASGQIFGVALWAMLTFRYWMRRGPPAGLPAAPQKLAED